MTKEDVLIDAQRKTDPYAGFTYTDPAIFKAMDEWAKHVAIEFDTWKWENRWYRYADGKWAQTLEHPTKMSDKTYNEHYRKTPEELYELFLKSK